MVVNGYENGYDDLNTGKHPWEGQHGDANGRTGGMRDDAEVVEALVLRRVSN